MEPAFRVRCTRAVNRQTLAALLCAALAVTACASRDAAAPASPGTEPTVGTSPSADPAAASTSDARGGTAAPSETSASGPPTATSIALTPLVEGLVGPVGVAHAGDGSGRLYVVEQRGTIRVVAPGTDGRWSLVDAPFLDIRELVSTGGERGLLGLAFHPEYDSNRRFFVHYTDVAGNSAVAEYAAVPDGLSADVGSARMLVSVEQPAPNHNGGMLAFGPDGYLYIALGDGGGGGDPWGHGQDPATVLGSILRIGVDGGSDPYAIPSDNPFVSGGGAPEVWAYGLRNPWRFSFDRSTGDLYIGDVGQSAWEEIDREPAGSAGGANYGWNVMEGAHCFGAEQCDQAGLTLPIAEYPLSAGRCAVTGGYVYRGEALPALQGAYLFADYCSGTIWGFDAGADRPQPAVLLESAESITSFGEDEAGEIYLVGPAGTLYVVGSAR